MSPATPEDKSVHKFTAEGRVVLLPPDERASIARETTRAFLSEGLFAN